MTESGEVRRFLEVLAAHPVLPPAEALPPNDEAFRALLADLARGESSSHAQTLHAVSAALLVPAEELIRRVHFVLACLVLPPSGNHYEVLGLTRDASAQEIRKRWAALIQRYHPDRLGGSSWLDGQARRLIEAYQTLKDPRRRQEYDAELGAGPGRPLPPPVKRVVRVPVPLGSSRARWAPVGIVAVGVAVAGWAVLRPVPPPLPRAPLPPAARILESPAGTAEPRRSTPPGPRGRVPDTGGAPVVAAPPVSGPAELPPLTPRVSGAAPAAPAPTPDAAAAASPREPATHSTSAAPSVAVSPGVPASSAGIAPGPAGAAPSAPGAVMPTSSPVIAAAPASPAPRATASAPPPSAPPATGKSLSEGAGPTAPPVPIAGPSVPGAALAPAVAARGTGEGADGTPKPATTPSPGAIAPVVAARVGAPAEVAAPRESSPPSPLVIATQPNVPAPPAAAAIPSAAVEARSAPVQAVALRPPAAAASATQASLPRDELLALIERFRVAYERKDLDAVMRLFGAEPRERNVSGRPSVQGLYAQNFAALAAIRYEISDLEVTPAADGQLVARGRFRIRAARPGDPTQRVDSHGDIRWHVRRESGELRITGIDYTVGAP